MTRQPLAVAVAGLGGVGLPVARALLSGGLPGLELAAVSARDTRRAADLLGSEVPVVALDELATRADIVVEALPPAAFLQVADPAVAAGRTLVVLSTGALMQHPELVDRAAATGARLLAPSGAILGLDALKAAAEGEIESVTIRTRKPPSGLKGAPLVEAQGIDLDALTHATCIFRGPVAEAIRHFPANVNVSATVALAGIGPDRTMIEVWADPALTRNTHQLQVASSVCNFTVEIESLPSPSNPRTGQSTAASVLACLRGLTAPLRIGS